MSKPVFTHSSEQLKQIAQDMLLFAKEKGASDAAVEISEGSGLSISVRKGKVETIEQNRDKGIGITVYIGQRRGNASTSDFSTQALRDTVDAAYNIARFTAEDDCAGLPDAELLEMAPRDLALCYPWLITAEQAIELAQRTEAAAFDVDPRISNSEGAGVHVQQSHFIAANSRGFLGGYPISRHTISVAPIAGKGAKMQRDDWYSSHRNPKQLASPEAIGRYAAERALARLNARKLSTRHCAVLFEAPLAAGLLGSFVQATSGGALYRKSSFLLDSLGTQVFPQHIQVLEDPHVLGAVGSSPFDDEGVKTTRRTVVDQGVLQGYFLSCYSARKLGMQTTGNAGGSHNLSLTSSQTKASDNFAAMLKKMGSGLLVTELMGQGVNYVTGDYSRGASGFWVEHGVIQYPVEEITIAGNMRDMFQQILAIGADTLVRGTKQTGSILIEKMMIAGS
ncbi:MULTISPECIES: metalloprotease PmbA [unclassified Undibacterium]|uniref:metalloprotease PmbA n=2 Tax=Undibacterium TaxID=401469 RepID=UPI002AC942F4|nr:MULTISPECIES: metalloprotease PmbA [unclassified Undibacterium]MEB0140118.1 metalloprotease PmbA [Undibacterium sp. CCC2.1]MEB0173905.1 metalloprotease PmbA [Undibacterium sp. CCC1.1]MEB0175679.1 metalloprotease PmbA [Undibacterium sp. CCC3.4]MEB0214467.1 metalloprotease PmbA [Undibacterium sp. 5I2]WPX42864.1 metalloprotease PmbA [Undibacterium sp. CCC3.4]